MEQQYDEKIKKGLTSVFAFLKKINSTPRGIIGFSLTMMFFLMSTIGPILLPLDPMSFNLQDVFLSSSWEHPLGTDYFGRDVLRMIIAGSRDVISVALLAACLTTIIALVIGLTAGYIGGAVDSILMTIADIVLTIPGFPLLLVLASTVFKKAMDPFSLAFVLSIAAWAGLSRSIRSQVLAIKERGFIEAAKCLGLSRFHLIFKEVLPNLAPYIAIVVVLQVTRAIYAEIGLFTLGVAPYSSTNWGVMLNHAVAQAGAIHSTKYMNLLAPAVFIILLQLGLITLAGTLDDILNPRLRKE